MLRVTIGHYPQGDWVLVVKINGTVIEELIVGEETAPATWIEAEFDLSTYAGQDITLELFNQSNGGMFESGYWAALDITAERSG